MCSKLNNNDDATFTPKISFNNQFVYQWSSYYDNEIYNGQRHGKVCAFSSVNIS